MIVILVAVLGAVTYANYRYARNNPGGVNFLVSWASTRALLTEGLNPYSSQVAERIQTLAYGHPAQAGEQQLRVTDPLYTVLVFLPFALIKGFAAARAAWSTMLEVGLVFLTFLSLRLTKWRTGFFVAVLLFVFSLVWYHAASPLILGNVSILVAVALAGGFLAMRNNADELAGVLFAFATIKPNIVILVLVFIVFWAAVQGRGKLISWFLGTLVLLGASAALIIPSWIVDNIREIITTPASIFANSPQAAFKIWWPWGERVGWALTAVMVLTILVEWWNNRHADFRAFLWTAYLTLTAGQWTGIPTDPNNYIVLFPALVLVFSLLDERWRTGGRLFVILGLLGLFAGIWAIFLNTVSTVNGQPVPSSIMFFPLPAFLLITLYWVRWWAVEPPTMWFDQLDR